VHILRDVEGVDLFVALFRLKFTGLCLLEPSSQLFHLEQIVGPYEVLELLLQVLTYLLLTDRTYLPLGRSRHLLLHQQGSILVFKRRLQEITLPPGHHACLRSWSSRSRIELLSGRRPKAHHREGRVVCSEHLIVLVPERLASNAQQVVITDHLALNTRALSRPRRLAHT